jgi:hypothetical protein
MRMRDCEQRFTEPGKDEEVASLGAAVGGQVFIQIGKRLWKLKNSTAFVQSFMQAEEEQYLNAH